MMEEHGPDVDVLLGIGGGTHKDARACDVVIADSIVYYNRRAVTVDGPKHRIIAYAVKAWLMVYVSRFFNRYGDLVVFKAAKGSGSPLKLLSGPLGTGEAVIKYRDAEERLMASDG
jgi:adenosylhomocysteine nucleosidase